MLAFENGSEDPDAEYFSDVVTESIISSLSKLPDVKVISRNSAFHYKGRTIDAEAVGRELDVEALVLGRIVQRGDDLSVSAELVRTRGWRKLTMNGRACCYTHVPFPMARDIGQDPRFSDLMRRIGFEH